MMNGKKKTTFEKLFEKQKEFQELIENKEPQDNPKLFQYHMTAMAEELGEILKADKRWKTHRNATYARDEKLDEIADMFITGMNISMWSGYEVRDVLEAIENKISVNNNRIDKG